MTTEKSYESLFPAYTPNPLCRYTCCYSSPFCCTAHSGLCRRPYSSCTALCGYPDKKSTETKDVTSTQTRTQKGNIKRVMSLPVDISQSRTRFGWGWPGSRACHWSDCGSLRWYSLHRGNIRNISDVCVISESGLRESNPNILLRFHFSAHKYTHFESWIPNVFQLLWFNNTFTLTSAPWIGIGWKLEGYGHK